MRIMFPAVARPALPGVPAEGRLEAIREGGAVDNDFHQSLFTRIVFQEFEIKTVV